MCEITCLNTKNLLNVIICNKFKQRRTITCRKEGNIMIFKKSLAVLTSAVMFFAAVTPFSSFAAETESVSTEASTEAEVQREPLAEKTKVGWSLIDTSDAVIAQTLQLAQTEADELNIDLLVSDAGSDATKQIDAVENFIESGCKVIIIQALDASSMANECKKAQEKGIKVIAYGIGIDGADVWYKNDNTVTGTAIGKMAADWINENKDGKANVYVIGYSMMDVLAERTQAIEDAIMDNAPESTIVGEFDALDSETGMSSTESMLAAHPEVDVICSISDGPAVGAFEAVKAAGKDNDDFAIFGSDLSVVALQHIKEGSCYRGTTDVDNLASGPNSIDMAYDLIAGKELDDTVVMGCKPVTIENVDDYDSLLNKE